MDKKQKSGESGRNMDALEVTSSYHKKTEMALRTLEERQQTILKGIEEGYVDVDLAGE